MNVVIVVISFLERCLVLTAKDTDFFYQKLGFNQQ